MSAEQDVLAASREIGKTVMAAADETEKNRNLSPEIVSQMKDAGIFSLCIPQRFGGIEAHPATTLEVIQNLAYGDASAAWVAMVCGATAIMAGYLEPGIAEEIYGQKGVITCGVSAPTGKARRVEGGIEVSGRWQWGSGTTHADWILGGSLLVDEQGKPMLDENGQPCHLLTFFSKDQVTLLDNWDVIGLAGSGSNDFVVEDAFVPEGRWMHFGVDQPRMSGLYQFPLLGILGLGVGSVSLGLARHAIDELIEIAGGKIPASSRRTLAHRAYVQSAVAEAEVAYRSAKLFVKDSVERAYDKAIKGEKLLMADRAELRLAITNASRQSTHAVNLMYNAAGGTPVYNKSPLSRIYRDAHVATQHIMVGPPTYELVGRVLLDMDVDDGAV